MGLQLGPKPLRKPPRGWIPARAFPLGHELPEEPQDAEGGGGGAIDTSLGLVVSWEVHVDGREPVEFSEARRAPLWISSGSHVGNRWYKVRLRRSLGLLKDVGVPGFVDPADPTRLWIDWDSAYEEHTKAWVEKNRTDRANAKRANERAAASLERAVAAGRAGVPDAEQAAVAERVAHAQWLAGAGRKASAVVVSQAWTRGTLAGMPVILITLDLEDGAGTRRVTYEHIWGRVHAEAYGVGKRITVRVDPGDPDRVELL
jgi:hypothetical protein